MPQGGKLSYTSLAACKADAKKQGLSVAPCESHFKKKKGADSADANAIKAAGSKKKNTGPVPQPDPRRNKKKGKAY